MPAIVDIYCRVSTDEQGDNTSLDEQEASARQFCRERVLAVAMVHREVYSGYVYRERDQLSLLRQRYQEGIIQGVVVRTFDRLARKEVHFGILLEEMEYHGVELYCVKEQLENTLLGRMTRMFLGFLAEWEREKIIDRTITGRINRIKEGKLSSAGAFKLMYGFQWHDPETKDFPVVHPKQATIIQELAERYVSGESCYALVRDLNARGVPSPAQEAIAAGRKPRDGDTGLWSERGIRDILTDPRITGKGAKVFTNHRKDAKNQLEPIEIPDGTYPAIISEELYQRILQRARTNQEETSRNGKNPEEYLLRAGFVTCECGRPMSGTAEYHKPNATHQYSFTRYIYTCTNLQDRRHKVNAKKLDALVWKDVEQLADYAELIERAIKLATSDKKLAHDARSIEASLERWKKKAASYEEDLSDPDLRGDTRAGIRQLLNTANENIEQLEIEKRQVMLGMIDREKEKEAYEKILAWCRKVKTAREPLTYQQKRDFFRLLGLVVVVEIRDTRREDIFYHLKVRLPEIQALLAPSTQLSELHEKRFAATNAISAALL